MVEFILNDRQISTGLPPGTLLLDFIRYHEHLTGTKVGCREGDCGACTILVGEIKNKKLQYSSATSCLMAIGNAHGKHILTIEGINTADALNPIQQAMADEGATQCGFCTPGFVMSLAGFCLGDNDAEKIVAAIDGNICRCTGYKSIERAAVRVGQLMENRKMTPSIEFLTQKNILPAYLTTIQQRLEQLRSKNETTIVREGSQLLGGGTDLYVQRPEEMKHADVRFLFNEEQLNGITADGNTCVIGASATVTDLLESPLIKQNFSQISEYGRLISSTPIRNMATIAGNFVNASPIGDLTIFFLALNAQLIIGDGKKTRNVFLRKFYRGYKNIDLKPCEFIDKIKFDLPDRQTHFHFEKVSKRTHLDIASVNSAIKIKKDKQIIFEAGISAGGVGPVPMYLEKTSSFLKGKIVSEELVFKTIEMARSEISPISDARGTAAYKKLLLGQLIKAHFIKLFPELEVERVVHEI